MESLDQLSQQLDSLDELRTIVKTMKALSAASIQQYERAVQSLAHYHKTVTRGLHVVVSELPSPVSAQPPATAGEPSTIVFGSDHGLCGRFNEEIVDFSLAEMAHHKQSSNNIHVLAVGDRAGAGLQHAGVPVEASFPLAGSASGITATVQALLLKVESWDPEVRARGVNIFHNRQAHGGRYQPASRQLLPVDLDQFRHLDDNGWPSRALPTFSMDREKLANRLVHQLLFITLFRACAESQASEHAGRLAAMQSAERNLNERIDEVTTTFRRARQDAITAELLDIVAGFESIAAQR